MRFAVEYACPGLDAHDRAVPIGLVAQDDQGIHVRALPVDAEAVSRDCGVPRGAITRWEAAVRSRTMDPVWGPDGEPLDPRDPRWLTRFAGAGMESKFYWGPVREVPGNGPDALEAAARAAIGG